MSVKDKILSTAVLATVEDTIKAGDFSYSAYGKTYDGKSIESIIAAVHVSSTQKNAFDEFKMHKQRATGLDR